MEYLEVIQRQKSKTQHGSNVYYVKRAVMCIFLLKMKVVD